MSCLSMAFIGVGNMSGAMINAYLSGTNAVPKNDKIVGTLHLCDVYPRTLAPFEGKNGVSIEADSHRAAAMADIIFLCVKPWQLEGTIADMGEGLTNKAVVSIAAGWSTEALQTIMPLSRVMRVMPNMPALVGKGVIAISDAHSLSEDELNAAQAFLSYSGLIEHVQEHQMDAITAVSGGGPAYVSLFLEALADAAVREGLPRDAARRVAAQTMLGSAMMAQDCVHTAVLKDAVLTPSGTTIEAMAHLERTSVRGHIIDAVHCAAERSRGLNGGHK